MGMNFYANDLHIGKSSAGWTFALRIYPDRRINNLEDWKRVLNWCVKITDEGNNRLSLDKMLEKIANRSWPVRNKEDCAYGSWDTFLKRNHAIDGPNNLLRRRIDGTFCVGHGEGTWDYCIGNFC